MKPRTLYDRILWGNRPELHYKRLTKTAPFIHEFFHLQMLRFILLSLLICIALTELYIYGRRFPLYVHCWSLLFVILAFSHLFT